VSRCVTAFNCSSVRSGMAISVFAWPVRANNGGAYSLRTTNR
jgi:hypothetical protein